MQVVAFDYDGVLVDFVGRVLNWLQENFNIRKTRADIHSRNILDLCPDATSKSLLLSAVRTDPKLYAPVQPLPGAAAAVSRIALWARPIVITSRRQRSLAKVTRYHVARFFPHIEIDDVRHAEGSKLPLLRAHRASWYIEDDPERAALAARGRIRTILIEDPSMPIPRDHARPSQFLWTAPNVGTAVQQIMDFYDSGSRLLEDDEEAMALP